MTTLLLKPRRERALNRCGHGTVAGLDEVGRGPLAGPVVAAAVVLDLKRVPKGLNDSKALTAARREELFGEIVANAHVGLASVCAREIDRINIRQATLLAMCRALDALPCRPDFALVDGNDPPGLPCPVETVIGGDGLVPSIAAASIVAKVIRDRIMQRAAEAHPHYGFTTNVGYGSRAHLSALRQYGPSPLHRLTFAPVRLAMTEDEALAA